MLNCKLFYRIVSYRSAVIPLFGSQVLPAILLLLLLFGRNADTHLTIPHRIEDWVDTDTAVRVHSPYVSLYIAEAALTSTAAYGGLRSCDPAHLSRACHHCRYMIWGANVYLVKSTNYRSNSYPKISKFQDAQDTHRPLLQDFTRSWYKLWLKKFHPSPGIFCFSP